MILKISFILSTLFIALYADINKNIHIAYPIYKYTDIQKNKIKSISFRAVKEIENELKIKVFPYFLKNEKEEIESFKKNKDINILMTYTSTYLRNKEFFKSISKEMFSMIGAKKDFAQYYLVSNKTSNIKTIKDLKNKKYAAFNGNENYTMWLDYLTLNKLGKPYKDVIKKKHYCTKEKSLILEVFFKKSDFTIISKKIYEDMLLLNPSLEKELNIIEKSKAIFTTSITFIHKNSSKKVVDDYYRAYINKGSIKRFEYLFGFIDADKMEKIEFKDLKPLEDFYDKYLKLKNNKLKL